MRRIKEYYKGKYAICLYDLEDETLVFMADNIHELANYLKKKINNVAVMLNQVLKGNSIIRDNNTRLKVELVNMLED